MSSRSDSAAISNMGFEAHSLERQKDLGEWAEEMGR